MHDEQELQRCTDIVDRLLGIEGPLDLIVWGLLGR